MNTVPVSDEMLRDWQTDETVEVAMRRVFSAPPGREADVRACEAVITRRDGDDYVAVPWKPSAADLAMLAAGGTLWLSTMGGLPPHRIEVR